MIVLFVFNFVSNWGNQEYLLRTYSKAPSEIFKHYFSSLTTRSVFLVFTLLLFFYYPLNIVLPSIGLIFLRFIYNSFQSLIIYHQKFKEQLAAEFIGFMVVLIPVVYQKKFSVAFFITVYIIATLLKLIMLLIVLKPFPKKRMFQFSKKHIVTASPFFLIIFSGWLGSKIDLYAVNYFLPPADLSQYQLLIMAFIMLQSVSALVIQPFSKHIYRAENKVFLKINRRLGLAAFPTVLIGSITIWYFLEQFTEVHFDGIIYTLLSLATLPMFFFAMDIFKYYKLKQEKTVVTITVFIACINFLIIFFLTPVYGVLGAVIGLLCSKWLTLLVYKTKLATYFNDFSKRF